MSIPRSSKGLLGVLCLGTLLISTPSSTAQDSGRKVLKKTPVAYPSILRSKGIGGVVKLRVFVKADGSVKDVEVMGGNPILAESAQKSVMQWKFSTGNADSTIEISVSFDPHSESGG